ncbi:MAG: peptidoglycan DD-metalloendopeptidase family protein [Helicobacteraceae bacterium]|jgi:septal ring factor EnvC (AmiA/AmiB activator)|nr:peptidoglycan DD-metalloendopeptidase family protein [Helicobacteraceae bacterium]
MRFFIFIALFLLANSVIFARTLGDLDREIKTTQTRIDKHKNEEDSLANKIDSLSREIERSANDLIRLEEVLLAGEKNIVSLSEKVSREKNEFSALERDRDILVTEKNALEKRLAKLVAKQTAMSLVLSKHGADQEDDLVRKEIFYTIRDHSEKESLRLKLAYSDKVSQLKKTEKRISELQATLNSLKDAENVQKHSRNDQKKLLEQLEKRKSGYLAELNKLIDQKNRERQMLADLKIVKQKTVDEMKQTTISQEEAERRESLGANALNVKQYGASYQDSTGKDYRGKKVDAPLDAKPIVITKNFGPYTDPIYHIKIHNDSVTLKAGEADALVRSVLPGKVVFADDLKILGKVVIVEHHDNLHTIYRNLENISPNIKVSGKLKERESIGRIERELVFEVTKDGLPINPLQLIAI